MSVMSSVEIRGKFVSSRDLLDVLSGFEVNFIFDGTLILGVKDEESAIDLKHLPITDNDTKAVRSALKDVENLGSIYTQIVMGGECQYLTFFFFDDDSIHFTIDGERKKTGSRYTDFSWYLENFIDHFPPDTFQIESICYHDEG